jgi:hypothetical protein
VNFTTQHTEKAVEASEKQGVVLPPFAAYSPSGNVTVRKYNCLLKSYYIASGSYKSNNIVNGYCVMHFNLTLAWCHIVEL